MDELFEVFDTDGYPIGFAPRSRCHGDPSLIHRTSHIVILHPDRRRIALQKRSARKDIQPGKWDTAVGGHLELGETHLLGALRELEEELGISSDAAELIPIFEDKIRNEIESENVQVYLLIHPGPFAFDRDEIDEVAFFEIEDLQRRTDFSDFTDNVVRELDKLWKIDVAHFSPPPSL
ncbi:MAG: NUDIX domain-containing protein [Victivallaceae bacterium]|nr:NUDIX domain-containing protein [Victivallaceae bacterium]